MPKISVIVPVYNTEQYLKKCLDSILDQTYQDFEVIVVNDGSTDNSERKIEEFVNKYNDKIKYFKKKNEGIAIARNFAIEQISGEYFIFVDSDDYIEPQLLENLNNTILERNIDLVKYKMNILDKNKLTRVNGPIFSVINGQEAFNNLCFSDKMIDTPCLYMFNTKFYKENQFKFLENTYHEDFGLIPLVIITASTVISIDYFGYNYLQVENSIIRNKNYNKTLKKANDLFIHYDYMIKYIEKSTIDEKTCENIKRYYSNALLRQLKNLKYADKKEYMKKIKTRRLLENIKVKNLKGFIKKILFFMRIDIY